MGLLPGPSRPAACDLRLFKWDARRAGRGPPAAVSDSTSSEDCNGFSMERALSEVEQSREAHRGYLTTAIMMVAKIYL
jgi:hypothetical protein